MLLGYLVAEGTHERAGNAIRFTNWDPEVSAEYHRTRRGHCSGPTVRRYDDDKEHCVLVDTKLRAVFADRYGQDYVNAAGKTVPSLRPGSGDTRLQRAFLSALYEGDGWIDTSPPRSGWAAPPSSSCVTCRLLLNGLGIPATVSS